MYLIKELYYSPVAHLGVEVYNKHAQFLGYLFYKYEEHYYRVGTSHRQTLESLKWVLENKECLVICTSDMVVEITSLK